MQLVSHNAEDTCLNNQHEPAQDGGSKVSLSEKGKDPMNGDISPQRDLNTQEQDCEQNTMMEPPCEVPEFPERGIGPWMVVAGSFCAMGAVFGLINSTAVFETYFKQNQLSDYSHSQIGWIFSLYLFLVFFVGIQVGPIFDRYGPKILVAIGSVLIVSSLMLLSISRTYWQIMLTYSVVGGLGGAMLNSPAYGAIAHFFNVRRGFATGVATTAGGFGGIAFPLLLQHLLGENGVGFEWSCRILGFILLGLCIPANILIRSRLPPRLDENGQVHVVSVWPDFSIFRNRAFTMATLGVFFMEWGLFIPLTYIVSYATDHGLGPTESSALLSVLNAGSVFGRFFPGLVADRFGRFNTIIATIGMCTIFVLTMWLPSGGSQPVLIVFSIFFGFSSGSNLSLMAVCLGQFCDSQDFGRYFSTAIMVASFGTLSSVPIGGALLGLNNGNGWTALVLFSGISYMAAFACYGYSRVLVTGWVLRAKF